jgi:hypothetical protein
MTDDATIGHDVLDEKRHLDALAGRAFRFVDEGPPPVQLPSDFPPGIYDVVPLDQLARRTSEGWVIVAVMDRPVLRTVRQDAVAPPEVSELTAEAARRARAANQGQFGGFGSGRSDMGPRMTGVTPRHDINDPSDPPPLPEVGSITLYGQVLVTEKVFLLRRDESSAIALAQEARVCAERDAGKERLARQDAIQARNMAFDERDDARTKAQLAENGAKYQATENAALRQRLGAMEADLAAMRTKQAKLIAGIGQIKAKEILGE